MPLYASAETLRIATFNTGLGRDGPGLFLRDVTRGGDDRIDAAARVIAANTADIIVLQGIDYDLTGLALSAFADAVSKAGLTYPYRFALKPNRGMMTALDLDGDGRLGRAGDAQGFGKFAGSRGMAILSRYPVKTEVVRDFSDFLWRDLPGTLQPYVDGAPFPSTAAHAIQRLSSSGHWVVPITLPDNSVVTLLAFHATPPVFDGPEDLNGRRNHDEIVFWQHFMDGKFGPAPTSRFVILGDANLDPSDSEGRRGAITGLLRDPRLQDPQPASVGAGGAANPDQRGDPAFDTADWRDPVPGNLRVDYVLPSADWTITGSGVHWPAIDDPAAQDAYLASRHRLVWVDLLSE